MALFGLHVAPPVRIIEGSIMALITSLPLHWSST
jgi:hypothetical protein